MLFVVELLLRILLTGVGFLIRGFGERKKSEDVKSLEQENNHHEVVQEKEEEIVSSS